RWRRPHATATPALSVHGPRVVSFFVLGRRRLVESPGIERRMDVSPRIRDIGLRLRLSDVVKFRFSDRKRSLGLLPVTLFFCRAQFIALRVRGPITPSTGPGSQSACLRAV